MEDQETRDMFASFCMMGFLSNMDYIKSESREMIRDMAEKAFAIADAMMEERNR